MKKQSDFIKDYVRRLNDDDLRFLAFRLCQRLGGDIGEAIEYLQKNQDIDRYFAAANSADAFFDLLDNLDNQLQIETKKRFTVHESPKKQTVYAGPPSERWSS